MRHTTVDASWPPSLKMKTPATVISPITALADVPLSRSSSKVRSGTHSSSKAIRRIEVGRTLRDVGFSPQRCERLRP
jgi:hypothetical protein